MKIGDMPSNLMVFICKHVFDYSRPIGLITYEDNGDLCMLCGAEDHDYERDGVKIVGLGHLWNRHKGIKEVVLEHGQQAKLLFDDTWHITRMPHEGEET